MKNKKLIALASLFLMATTALAVTGCKPNEDPPVLPEYTVDIQGESVRLTLGDTTRLTVNYDLQEGAVLAFASSDPSVVTVDEYGNLTALKLGTAIITATYGDLSDTCTVEVTLGDQLPMLQMSFEAEEFTIYKDQQQELAGTVLFNGKTYEDVELTYEVSDETVGKVEDGVFKPLAEGTTTVTVTASWRGITEGLMTKTITFTVVPKVVLTVNGGISEINLWTETVEGTDYVATSSFEVVASIDDVPLAVTAELTSGSRYVDFDGTTVSSKGFVGEAEITLSYEIRGEAKTQVIPVHVTPTLYNYEGVVENFSIIHGEVAKGKSLRSILGTDILAAYDENGNPLTVENNKLFGIEDNKSADGIDTTITIYSARRGYTVRLTGYSGIFAEAEDFEVFDINASYASGNFSPIDTDKPMGAWDGYYVLLNNIDATNYVHRVGGGNLSGRGQANNFPCGLQGTFDGRGYTVKGMTIGAYGVFGYISNGATVKDVAFVDVKLQNAERAATLAQWIYNATISNVYIQLAEGTYSQKSMSGFAGGISGSTVSNCIVELDKNCVFTDQTSSVFACALHEYANEGEGKTTYTNVYVITTSDELGYYKYDKNEVKEYRHFFAENKMPVEEAPAPAPASETTDSSTDSSTSEDSTAGTTDGSTGGEGTVDPELPDEPQQPATPVFVDANYMIKGVFAYGSVEEMLAAGNNYAAFITFWDVTGGTPVWKSVDGEYPVIEEEEESGYNGESVGDFNPDWIK